MIFFNRIPTFTSIQNTTIIMMKNLLITATFLVFSACLMSQVSLPIDPETNLVSYEEILDEEGTAAELFERALAWFNSHYPNPRNVIQETDKDLGKITGKHKFKIQIPDKKGIPVDVGYIKYTIKIWAKDGKYRYKITEFNLEYVAYSPIEIWMDEAHAEYETNQKKLQAIDDYINKLIDNLAEAMIPPKKTVNEDDW